MPDIWLPDAPLFLESGDAPPVRPHRPVFQGDVFVDVPVGMFTRFKEDQPDEADLKAKRTTVMTFTHPCSMRNRGGRLKQAQVVARVLPKEKVAKPEWSHPWVGNYALFPLPDLEGEELVADLSQIGITHSGYLDDRRVACLNLDGWIGLVWRITNYFSRFELPIDAVREINLGHWHELELWEKWVQRTGAEDGYQDWLNEPLEAGGDTQRRRILAGDIERLEESLPVADS